MWQRRKVQKSIKADGLWVIKSVNLHVAPLVLRAQIIGSVYIFSLSKLLVRTSCPSSQLSAKSFEMGFRTVLIVFLVVGGESSIETKKLQIYDIALPFVWEEMSERKMQLDDESSVLLVVPKVVPKGISMLFLLSLLVLLVFPSDREIFDLFISLPSL